MKIPLPDPIFSKEHTSVKRQMLTDILKDIDVKSLYQKQIYLTQEKKPLSIEELIQLEYAWIWVVNKIDLNSNHYLMFKEKNDGKHEQSGVYYWLDLGPTITKKNIEGITKEVWNKKKFTQYKETHLNFTFWFNSYSISKDNSMPFMNWDASPLN